MFNDIEEMMNNLFGPRYLTDMLPSVKDFSEVSAPVDIYTTEKGDKVIELAVCGKTKDDFEISTETGDDGFHYLTITTKEEEKKEDEVQKTYQVHKLKRSFDKIGFVIENKFDIESISASVTEGLLKVIIPSKLQKEKRIIEIK